MNDLETIIILSLGAIQCALAAYLCYKVIQDGKEELHGNYAPIMPFGMHHESSGELNK